MSKPNVLYNKMSRFALVSFIAVIIIFVLGMFLESLGIKIVCFEEPFFAGLVSWLKLAVYIGGLTASFVWFFSFDETKITRKGFELFLGVSSIFVLAVFLFCRLALDVDLLLLKTGLHLPAFVCTIIQIISMIFSIIAMLFFYEEFATDDKGCIKISHIIGACLLVNLSFFLLPFAAREKIAFDSSFYYQIWENSRLLATQFGSCNMGPFSTLIFGIIFFFWSASLFPLLFVCIGAILGPVLALLLIVFNLVKKMFLWAKKEPKGPLSAKHERSFR